MYLDSDDHLGLFTRGVYEPFETAIVRKLIKPNDLVVDIGANIGYYTLLFAGLVGAGGKVVAYEPDSYNFNLLRRNVELNACSNVVTINKAVSSQSGSIEFFLSEDIGDHRVYDPGDGRKRIAVEAIRLDDDLQDQNVVPDFLKMDIQGGEWQACKGMEQLLTASRDLKILTEFWPRGLLGAGVEPEAYLELLLTHGFHLYHLNEVAHKVEPLKSIMPIDAWMTDLEGYTNVLCLKSPEPLHGLSDLLSV